jgi:hypothetical protein
MIVKNCRDPLLRGYLSFLRVCLQELSPASNSGDQRKILGWFWHEGKVTCRICESIVFLPRRPDLKRNHFIRPKRPGWKEILSLGGKRNIQAPLWYLWGEWLSNAVTFTSQGVGSLKDELSQSPIDLPFLPTILLKAYLLQFLLFSASHLSFSKEL